MNKAPPLPRTIYVYKHWELCHNSTEDYCSICHKHRGLLFEFQGAVIGIMDRIPNPGPPVDNWVCQKCVPNRAVVGPRVKCNNPQENRHNWHIRPTDDQTIERFGWPKEPEEVKQRRIKQESKRAERRLLDFHQGIRGRKEP